jgi:hypothetical protein
MRAQGAAQALIDTLAQPVRFCAVNKVLFAA